MTEEEIHEICKQYKIEKYKINPDMTIDVNGGIDFYGHKLTRLPLKFRRVNGFIECSNNRLTTLEGLPQYSPWSFDCSHNKLTSLIGMPNEFYTGSNFYCNSNKLTSLEGLPINFHIEGKFLCSENSMVKSEHFGRLLFGYIGGTIETDYDVINKFLNENKNPPKKDLPRLLSELRKIKI